MMKLQGPSLVLTAFILPQPVAAMPVLFSWKHQTRDEMHLFYGLSEAGLKDLQRSVPELSYDPHEKKFIPIKITKCEQ